jgi:hypothetical protein
MSVVDIATAVERLLEPGFDATAVTVGGLRLADPVSRIDQSRALAGYCPNVPCLSRSFSSSGEQEIQRHGEPQLRPYPLTEIVDDVCRHGGWVELSVATSSGSRGATRLDIDDGHIVGIHMLAEPWLDPLGLRSAQSIARVFGHNDRHGRSYQRTTWSWPERGLAIVWNDERECLQSISLGPRTCASVPMFGAKDLIRLALRWNRLHPDDDWPLRPRASSMAEPIIARRIGALMHAFDLADGAPSLAGFFAGTFLARQQHEPTQTLLAYLGEPERGRFRFTPGVRDPFMNVFALRSTWSRMLALRRHIEVIDAFNDGVMVASGIHGYMFDLAQHASNQLEPERDHIDHALSLILDPAQRRWTWGELVREHGFPDDDLDHCESEDCT